MSRVSVDGDVLRRCHGKNLCRGVEGSVGGEVQQKAGVYCHGETRLVYGRLCSLRPTLHQVACVAGW